MTKTIYNFNHIHSSQDNLKSLLGGKGAGLNTMTTTMGLPVPQGFTIPCHQTLAHAGHDALDSKLRVAVKEGIITLEEESKRNFGGSVRPLILSVRSGAPQSMPGMMETILNLGLNDKTVVSLAEETNEAFAYDSYRRFIQMYATIVLEDDPDWYAQRTDTMHRFFGGRSIPVTASQLLINKFKERIDVPQDVHDQLSQAILAVFRSWESDKAVAYREIEGIPSDLGTAVNVQRMVFGNMNDNSGTGVAFTRNPNTGENVHYGDFLVNAQGEDVVDGSSETLPLSEMSTHFPEQYKQLMEIMGRLEDQYNDMCDIEFTIENGKLFMLQTRVGKRSSLAEIKIVSDLLDEGRITEDEASERLLVAETKEAAKVHVKFDGKLLGRGQGAAGGLVIGKAAFSTEQAIAYADSGDDVILCRPMTTPDDTAAMAKSVGILTLSGGLVSHAAVVARSWNKTAVVGVSGITSGSFGSTAGRIDKFKIKNGQLISINGETGEIFGSAVDYPDQDEIRLKSAAGLAVGDIINVPSGGRVWGYDEYENLIDFKAYEPIDILVTEIVSVYRVVAVIGAAKITLNISKGDYYKTGTKF